MITQPALQELLFIQPQASSTANSQATHGAAVAPAVGGSFTIGARTSVDLSFDYPFASVPTATSVEAHILVDGTCVLEVFVFCWAASVGTPMSRTVRVTGLAAGVHSLAVNLKTGAGIGTLQATSTNTARIVVREA